jgi:hypothetical protein
MYIVCCNNVIFNRTYLFDYMYVCTVFYPFYFIMTISTSYDCTLYGSMENEVHEMSDYVM